MERRRQASTYSEINKGFDLAWLYLVYAEEKQEVAKALLDMSKPITKSNADKEYWDRIEHLYDEIIQAAASLAQMAEYLSTNSGKIIDSFNESVTLKPDLHL